MSVPSTLKVLITRPDEEAIITQNLLRQRDIVSDKQEFLTIHHQDCAINVKNYAALIFTSRQAVRSFVRSNNILADMPVFCVGEATAILCRDEGFREIYCANGTVADLQALLNKESFARNILYVCGRDIATLLVHPQLEEVVVYYAEQVKEVDGAIEEALLQQQYSHILFYSVRTAQAFCDYIRFTNEENILNQTKALCLAPSMVKFLSVLPWGDIQVAKAPNQNALLELFD